MTKLDFKQLNVLVIGDAMLDIYISGKVSRISPEAPVPVVDRVSTTYHAGGAANAASNIKALGCNTSLACAIGKDEDTPELFLEMLHSLGLSVFDCSYAANSWNEKQHGVKTRIVGNDYQIVRLDEDRFFSWNGKENELVSLMSSDSLTKGEKPSCVILSDYGKGMLNEKLCQGVIQYCKKKSIPTFVDPKDGDWGKYRGAFCIKPNIFELSKQFPGTDFSQSIDDIRQAADRLIERFSFDCMAITRGDQGMIFVEEDNPSFFNFPADKVEVFDVSGAGDTAMAVMSACFAAGLPMSSAVHFANKAAASVVCRKGTQTVRLEDIEGI